MNINLPSRLASSPADTAVSAASVPAGASTTKVSKTTAASAAIPLALSTVSISKAARAALAEATGLAATTAKEAGRGNRQVHRLLAKEATLKSG
jgi:hypothetical protein